MIDLWFWLVAATFAAYVVLDGYDLGAGIVSPFIAKNDHERHEILATILPFWDGNEVFLVAGGATLYLAFPRLFPLVMSGFYLPVMIVLWLLAARGLGIEMRHKLDQPLWNQLWDGAFFGSSLLLVAVFGAALGNLVRGLSIDANGDFFAPLWTDFGVGEDVGILDWYTVLVALTAVVLIARHGALRLGERLSNDLGARAGAFAKRWFAPSMLLAVVTTVATFRVRPDLGFGSGRGAFAAVALAGLVLSWWPRFGFRASSAALVGLFGEACASVHPFGLVARVASRSIRAADVAAEPHALQVGLVWWLPGMAAVIAYSIVAHRKLLISNA
jgi:cytochrome d ubiquinol oxidase subunit II